MMQREGSWYLLCVFVSVSWFRVWVIYLGKEVELRVLVRVFKESKVV